MLVFLFFFFTLTVTAVANDAVPLKDIQVLTLYKGRQTTGRRSSPVPQLSCVGGAAQAHSYRVETVQCYNKGFDGSTHQWECISEMDKSLKLGAVTVTCEGYHYPDDPLVLKGSCGLEYFLEFSPIASQPIPPKTTPIVKKTITTTATTATATKLKGAEVESRILVIFICYAILAFIIYMLVSSWLTVKKRKHEEQEPLIHKSFVETESYIPFSTSVVITVVVVVVSTRSS